MNNNIQPVDGNATLGVRLIQAWRAVNQQTIDRWLARGIIAVAILWLLLQLTFLTFRPVLLAELSDVMSPDITFRIPQRVCSAQETFVLPQKVVHLAFLNGPRGDDDVLEMLVDTLFQHGFTATFFISNETYLSERTEAIYKRALTYGNTLEVMVLDQDYDRRSNISIDDMVSNISSSEAFVQRLRGVQPTTAPSTTALVPSKKYIWESSTLLSNEWFKKNHYQRVTSSIRRFEWLVPTNEQATIIPWKLIGWNIKSWFWQLEILTAVFSTNIPTFYGSPVVALNNARYSIPVLQDLVRYWMSHGWQVTALPPLDLVERQMSDPNYCATLNS